MNWNTPPAPLTAIGRSSNCALYKVARSSNPVISYVSSTKESRSICNDPRVVGVQYTNFLKKACVEILRLLEHEKGVLDEGNSCVLHILRGGLNFGLREALFEAYGWNTHSSAFVTAQRARRLDSPEDWFITEHSYRKVELPDRANIFLGDVAATGTSLRHGLAELLAAAQQQGRSLERLYFFTIGSPHVQRVLAEFERECRSLFPNYKETVALFLEGIFDVPTPDTPLTIKLTGTDLLRTGVLAPEFVESQYENPTFPLERCTIYDAGSRAFSLQEYREDVIEYWEQVKDLAMGGMTYSGLLRERMPQLENRFPPEISLSHLAETQLCYLRKI